MWKAPLSPRRDAGSSIHSQWCTLYTFQTARTPISEGPYVWFYWFLNEHPNRASLLKGAPFSHQEILPARCRNCAQSSPRLSKTFSRNCLVSYTLVHWSLSLLSFVLFLRWLRNSNLKVRAVLGDGWGEREREGKGKAVCRMIQYDDKICTSGCN